MKCIDTNIRNKNRQGNDAMAIAAGIIISLKKCFL